MINTAYPTGERKAMHARLKQLTGRWLLTEEAKKLEEIAEALSVPLQWCRHDFAGGKCVAIATQHESCNACPGRTQHEEPCYS